MTVTASTAAEKFPLRRIVAPCVVIAFMLGWYRFSSVYIQTDDASLIAHGNYAVYVPIQQVSAYMQALGVVTYVIVYVCLIMLWTSLVRYVEFKEAHSSG
ncbi:MAG: hypothetical protein QXI37_04010 [Thermoprotei archaeon]